MERSNRTVNIQISGDVHVGKTIIASIIEKALAAEGFTAINVVNDDGDFAAVAARYRNGEKFTGSIKDVAINILDTNAPVRQQPNKASRKIPVIE